MLAFHEAILDDEGSWGVLQELWLRTLHHPPADFSLPVSFHPPNSTSRVN